MTARPYIGGQAVLEGVMMRAPTSFAVVVRRRDGALLVRERPMRVAASRFARWPLVRGLASLVESLKLGSEALHFSAEQMERDLATVATRVLGAFGAVIVAMAGAGSEGEASHPAAGSKAGHAGGRPDAGDTHVAQAADAQDEARGSRAAKAGTWLMLAFAIAFFIALPQGAAAGLNRVLGLGLPIQGAEFQAITGAFKLVIVVGYMLAIRRVPDIRRVFQYHGAEHKAISTYEAGEPLTVASARAKTTLHPRCGTTFLVMVALVSILVFTGIGAMLPRIHTGSALADNAVFLLEKLPFLPVLVAVTFELQRVLARRCATGPLRALLWPGFVVQKITTAEPDDSQLEVALASLRVTLFREEEGPRDGDVHGGEGCAGDLVFPSYDALLAADRLRAVAA